MALQRGALCASLILLATTACVAPGEHLELRAANEDLQRHLKDLARYQQELESENGRLQDAVKKLAANAVDAEFVRQEKEKLARLIGQFQAGGDKAIPGVSVVQYPDGVAFRLEGAVLFSSGQAEVTPAGKAALKTLLPSLMEHGQHIRIDGHTDTDRIKRSPWKTNWRLSSERAMAVLDFLTKNGIDPQKCFVAAYGEFRPAVDGSSAEAKGKNRRVEILMVEG